MKVVGLLARSCRASVAVWVVLVTGLAGGTVALYQDTYPTSQARAVAVAAARRNPATTLLYGLLPGPGTPAQMFCWEIGTFVTILVAVAAVILTTRLTRGSEQDGTLELIRAAGVRPSWPLLAAALILTGTAVLLGAGSWAALAASRPRVPSLTWGGDAAFGCVVAVTFLAIASITLVASQIMPTAETARGAALALVAAAWAARAAADAKSISILSAISPLGLRQSVAPFTSDRWWALAAWAGVCAGLVGAAAALNTRREYGAGLLRPMPPTSRHLTVRTPFGLAWRLDRASHATWAAAVSAGALLFTAMGAGLVTSLRHQHHISGFLGSQLAGADPAVAYLTYLGTLVGITVSVHAVWSTIRSASDERSGRTEQLRSLGLRAWLPMAGQAAAAITGCLAALLVTATAVGLAAPHLLTGHDIGQEAFTQVIGQGAAVICLTGVTALAAGAVPRWAGLAWVPFAASAVLTLLGPLLGAPSWLIRLSLFGHVHNLDHVAQTLAASSVLVSLGVLTALAGLAMTSSRDLVNA